MSRLPATQRATETRVKSRAVGSKANMGTNGLQRMVKTGEKRKKGGAAREQQGAAQHAPNVGEEGQQRAYGEPHHGGTAQ